MPPPVPVDSTTGVFMPDGLAELLGDRGGERINGGRSDDADLVARFGGAGNKHAGRRERERAGEGLESSRDLSCSIRAECESAQASAHDWLVQLLSGCRRRSHYAASASIGPRSDDRSEVASTLAPHVIVL